VKVKLFSTRYDIDGLFSEQVSASPRELVSAGPSSAGCTVF